jgi:hypothetical protein
MALDVIRMVKIAAPQAYSGDPGWVDWKGLKLWFISILHNQGLPVETGRRIAVTFSDQAAF